MQPLDNLRKTASQASLLGPFVCDPDLAALLQASAPKNQQLLDEMRNLSGDSLKIHLSRKDPDTFADDVHKLIAESPRALKCVLSDEHHREKPSLYIKDGTNGQSAEIVFASSRNEQLPVDDLAFATHFISEWNKNNKTWPNIHACFQPPQEVPADLLSGIDKTSISQLRNRKDVCDLSDVGFKPFHGDDAPTSVTARVITMKAAQGDNKMVAHAIKEQVRPGDVLVLDAGGHAANATVGGIVGSFAAKNKGVKAILVYGEMRDQLELKGLSVPVFTLGCTPNGPSKAGPGATHCSLNIGNTPFKSGDIIKIDQNQIVVVPRQNAESILDSNDRKDEAQTAQKASPSRSEEHARTTARKTFESAEKEPPKNRPRPETPSFIPKLFKEFAPAHITDSASFMKPDRLWGAGEDMALRMGSIPDGKTIAGEAVLSTSSEQGIESALRTAKTDAFLVISGQPEARLTAATMKKIHDAGISCIVVDGKAVIDEIARQKYNIPCFSRERSAPEGPTVETNNNASEPPSRFVLSDGFTIKPGYVMLADADGIAAFSPTKYATMYRTGSKKVAQEMASEQRNRSEHAYPLPKGSIASDRFYEPFAHAHIDQFPFLAASRGIAAMKLPAEPTDVHVGLGDQKIKLGPDETLKGIPEKITTHGEKPLSFTLRNQSGEVQEVEGVLGPDLFKVALAAERGEAIEVRGDGHLVKT